MRVIRVGVLQQHPAMEKNMAGTRYKTHVSDTGLAKR